MAKRRATAWPLALHSVHYGTDCFESNRIESNPSVSMYYHLLEWPLLGKCPSSRPILFQCTDTGWSGSGCLANCNCSPLGTTTMDCHKRPRELLGGCRGWGVRFVLLQQIARAEFSVNLKPKSSQNGIAFIGCCPLLLLLSSPSVIMSNNRCSCLLLPCGAMSSGSGVENPRRPLWLNKNKLL